MIRLDRHDWLKLRAKEARNFTRRRETKWCTLASALPVAQGGGGDASARKPGERLYALPSPLQRLARTLLHIISKMRVHADAGPFLEPVLDREFPEYKEIVLHPINLGKIAKTTRQRPVRRHEAP
jgi:hypothetical protein